MSLLNFFFCDILSAFHKLYFLFHCFQADFRDFPFLLRQAISIARRVRDPLVEFSQLCTADDEILCLRYHPLQVWLINNVVFYCIIFYIN